MIHNWPASLPRPERDSWQLQPMEARRKSQPDAGPPGYRRRFTSVPRQVSLSVLLTRQQRAEFDTFWSVTCREGADLFRMPDPSTEGWALTDDLGQPLLIGAVPLVLAGQWLCSWGDGTPIETLQGVEFRKAFAVVVMP